MDKERFLLPPRVTFAEDLSKLLDAKLREGFTGHGLSEAQLAEVVRTGFLDLEEESSSPLLEADRFRISMVHRYGEEDRRGLSGIIAADIYLFKDGSPFVFDADMAAGVTSELYVLLAGPDAMPTLVHSELLERIGYDDSKKGFVEWENWNSFSGVRQTYGDDVIHSLSDRDCQNILQAVTNGALDHEFALSRIPELFPETDT